MKRGYMDWKQDLLPEEQLKQRQNNFIEGFQEKNIDATVVFGDVASADELQYLTNLGPYWGSAVAVFFKDGTVRFVTAFSARVNPWVSQITGIDSSKITAAGPKLNAKLAEVIKGQLGGTGVIGLTGKYIPQEMVEILENSGFKTSMYQENLDEQLTTRDAAYNATIKQGIGVMNTAINKVLQNQEIRNLTKKQIAAEVEYSCRTAGAMDMLILNGNQHLVFGQLEEVLENENPWTLYVQIQYLGEWLVVAKNMKEGYSKEAQAARDRAVKALIPGQKQLSWEEDGYSFKITPKILSDHLSSQGQTSCSLQENQIVSLAVTDKVKGVYLEDMYQVAAKGGQQLTAIEV